MPVVLPKIIKTAGVHEILLDSIDLIQLNHMAGHPRCVFINYIWLKLIVEHN